MCDNLADIRTYQAQERFFVQYILSYLHVLLDMLDLVKCKIARLYVAYYNAESKAPGIKRCNINSNILEYFYLLVF